MSYSNIASYMPGDRVQYTGERHRQELGSKVGWVHASVEGSTGSYVVFFPDTKEQDSYILHESILREYHSNERVNGPEIAPRRRKKEDD